MCDFMRRYPLFLSAHLSAVVRQLEMHSGFHRIIHTIYPDLYNSYQGRCNMYQFFSQRRGQLLEMTMSTETRLVFA